MLELLKRERSHSWRSRRRATPSSVLLLRAQARVSREAVAATSLLIVLRARVADEAPRPRGRAITARSLRRPALPPSSARAQARRQNLPPPHVLATPAPAITRLSPPPFTKPTHNALHHRARATTPPACRRLRRPFACEGLRARHHPSRPSSHIRTSSASRTPVPPLAASHARFSYPCPPLRRDVATELSIFSASLSVDIH